MPSREVYLRGVINLSFACNKLCNFLAFILRLCTNIFCEAPPPLCAGEVTNAFLFVHLHRRRACFLFCEAPPPFARLAWMMTVKRALAPLASCFNYARLCLQLSRNRTFHPSLSCDGILLGDLRLFSRRGSRLAFGFRATGLSTLRFHATGFC